MSFAENFARLFPLCLFRFYNHKHFAKLFPRSFLLSFFFSLSSFFHFFFSLFFLLIRKINDSLCFRKFNPFEQESSRVPLLECCHIHHENCLYIMHGKSAFNFSRIHREKTRLYYCFRES